MQERGQTTLPSDDQHGVAEAVETITQSHGFLISTIDEFFARESRYQHQQGRAGEMKVCDQDVYHFELVSGQDEECCPAPEGFKWLGLSVCLSGLFQQPDCGCRCTDYTVAICSGWVKLR